MSVRHRVLLFKNKPNRKKERKRKEQFCLQVIKKTKALRTTLLLPWGPEAEPWWRQRLYNEEYKIPLKKQTKPLKSAKYTGRHPTFGDQETCYCSEDQIIHWYQIWSQSPPNGNPGGWLGASEHREPKRDLEANLYHKTYGEICNTYHHLYL